MPNRKTAEKQTRPKGRAKRKKTPALKLPLELSEDSWVESVGMSTWGLLDRLHRITPGRPGYCRRVRTSPTVQVSARSDGGVSLSGVATCGSVWACPVCSARVCAERAEQVIALVDSWGRDRCIMLTATVRHSATDTLSREIRGVARAWQALWAGRAVAEARERWGIGPWVRAIEATHGANGWHVHVHAIICLSTPLGADWSEMREQWSTRWRDSVARHIGVDAMPSDEHGVSIEPVHVASYIAKLGLEVSGARKQAHSHGSRHPWDIALGAASGDPMSVMLWREYVLGTRGRRQLTWSRGARHMARTDAEIVSEAEGGALLLEYSPEQWRRLAEQPCGIAKVIRICKDSVAC